MKFPVVSSTRHKGKTLEIDSSKETITLVGINGEPMGSLAWDFLVDQILTYRKPQQSREGDLSQEFRSQSGSNIRRPTARTSKVEQGGDWGGGLFIESFRSTDRGNQTRHGIYASETPNEWLSAKGHDCLGLPESRSVHI